MATNTTTDDLFSLLDDLVQNSPKATAEYRIERLRLALSASLRHIRTTAGVNQKDLAKALGVNQPWVSKLESPNNDHTFESIARFLFALGSDITLSASNSELSVELASSQNDGSVSYRAGQLPAFVIPEDDTDKCPTEYLNHWISRKLEGSMIPDRKSIWILPNVA